MDSTLIRYTRLVLRVIYGPAYKVYAVFTDAGAALSYDWCIDMQTTFRENTMTIRALLGSILLVGVLSGCNAVDAMKDGMAQSNAVADDLEKSLGAKPRVGFNWFNGSLANVTVEFNGTPKDKTLDEINNAARAAVKKEFSQTPKKIVLAFDVDAS